jgi:hypothetical protein
VADNQPLLPSLDGLTVVPLYSSCYNNRPGAGCTYYVEVYLILLSIELSRACCVEGAETAICEKQGLQVLSFPDNLLVALRVITECMRRELSKSIVVGSTPTSG